MKKTKLIGKILEIALVFVLIGTMLGGLPAFLNKVEASPGTIYVPDDYSTIQAAADASSPGDTIIVRAGTYTENIDVNKSDLTIDSESGADVTIIQAANSNDHVFHVYNVNGVRISGFTIKGATAELKGGISLDGANSCEIVDNVVSENWVGIGLYMARDNTIRRNTFSNNTYGGGVSEDPTTPCAVAEAVYEAGITAEPEETLDSLRVLRDQELTAAYVDSYYEYSPDMTRILISDPELMLRAAKLISKYMPAVRHVLGQGGEDLEITEEGAQEMVSFLRDLGEAAADRQRILGVARSTTLVGLLDEFEDQVRTSEGKMFSEAFMDSVYCAGSTQATRQTRGSSPNNIIYLNNFTHNTNNVRIEDSTNTWNSLAKMHYVYDDNAFEGFLGNYWGDYTGGDPDGDGVGNTPYSIDEGNSDNYPLREPFEDYELIDSFADLGNPEDEAWHNLAGWGSMAAYPENPYVSPSGDRTKRYQILKGDNSVDLWVDQVGIDYTLTAEVEDGICTDNFEIYIDGRGPVYSYTGKHLEHAAVAHQVPVSKDYITDHRVTVTFRNTATDDCGLAAVYNVGLTSGAAPPSEWVGVASQTGAYICNDSVDFQFERDLAVGSIGNDVKYLQILLNSNPLTQLAIEGDGSPGKETSNFGPITEAAVKEFQKKRTLPQTGLVAGDTRTALNALLRQYAPVKHVPNGWVLRVIDRHGNSEIHDACIWWEIGDATDGIRGWIPYKNTTNDATYLEEIAGSIGEQRTQTISSVDARKSIIVDAVRNRATLFPQLISFPSELMLAIIAGEMPANADNTRVAFDCGRGISQITDNSYVGKYSGVRCYSGSTNSYMPYEFVWPFDRSVTQAYWTDRGCINGTYQAETSYRNCGCKGEQECEGTQAWYYGGTDTSGRCRYYPLYDDLCRVYTNTAQGIEANLKDGKGVLKDCFVDSLGKNENTESNFMFAMPLTTGDRGKEVAYLQYILKSEIDQNLPITAYFGSMTEQALRDFQAIEFPSKEPSGVVDLDTRNTLGTLLDSRYSYLRSRVEDIKSWVGATWRYNHGSPTGTIMSDARNYLAAIATRLETLGQYFPNYETHLDDDLLDEADRQFLLAVMKNYQYFEIRSPVELRVYDSEGNVTGMISGQPYENIPDSLYDTENEVAMILLPSGGNICEVVGIAAGSYGAEAGFVQDGEIVMFGAENIPINVNTVHRYLIDWDALAQGEAGVTVQVDSDGDGIFEDTFTSDGELTQDEFLEETGPSPFGLEIFAFGDANVNGQPDPGEEGLGGWHFEVTGPGGYRWKGSTPPTGSISLEDLAEGVYTVTETPKQGWYNTTPLVRKATVRPDTSVRLSFGNREELRDIPPMVPSMNRWGVIIMIALFAGSLVWTMRRRRLTS